MWTKQLFIFCGDAYVPSRVLDIRCFRVIGSHRSYRVFPSYAISNYRELTVEDLSTFPEGDEKEARWGEKVWETLSRISIELSGPIWDRRMESFNGRVTNSRAFETRVKGEKGNLLCNTKPVRLRTLLRSIFGDPRFGNKFLHSNEIQFHLSPRVITWKYWMIALVEE